MLTFSGERTVREFACPECGDQHHRIWQYINRDGQAHAVCFAYLYAHEGVAEVYLDAILGTWGEDSAEDHVTFGCRVGPIDGQPQPAATLVAAAQPFGDHAIYGHKLTRDEALGHPRLGEFWSVVDFVLEQDAEVHNHVYGPPLSAGPRRRSPRRKSR